MINVPNVQVSDTMKADRYSGDGQQKNSNKKAIESSTAFQFYKKEVSHILTRSSMILHNK